MAADDYSVVQPWARGRNSIRIRSKAAYADSLIVLDLTHMPEGCATWPAFWSVAPDWPSGGEIDTFEGVNNVKNNRMTLHTEPVRVLIPILSLFPYSPLLTPQNQRFEF